MFGTIQKRPRILNRVTLALLSLCVAFLVSGCRKASMTDSVAVPDAHRYALEGEMRDAGAEQASLAAAMQSEVRASEEISSRIASDRKALAELQAALHSYMQQHNIAIAALLAGAASTDVFLDRETSDDARQLSAGVGIIVLLWAASHQEELADVVQTLEAAKNQRTALQGDVTQAQAEYNNQLGLIDNLKLRENKANEKIRMIRVELCGSPCVGGQ